MASLPPELTLRPHRAAAKIVVLDDDPTGTQTVHGIPVLTTWAQASLEDELREPESCCYILTNTRALSAARAGEINRQIGERLGHASAATGRAISVVSRSDSTLRGHFPVELDHLAAGLGTAFSGILVIPAFFAGGRFTIDDIHYVADGDALVPAAETEFARDVSFGYRSSNLRAWVEEKTGGRVRQEDVASISIRDLRSGGPDAVAKKLGQLSSQRIAVVNAAAPSDLAVLTHALARAEAAGQRFLFRTAADFVAAYAAICPRPLLVAEELMSSGVDTGGLLVVGSHVGKTSVQLARLLAACPQIVGVELPVAALLDPTSRARTIARATAEITSHLTAGENVALYTSRKLVTGTDGASSQSISERVSVSLVEVVKSLEIRPRWLIAKGGITSSDIATGALGIRRAMVLGQALPGVPVWRTGAESKWPGLAYVVFPGNVGSPDALAGLITTLAR